MVRWLLVVVGRSGLVCGCRCAGGFVGAGLWVHGPSRASSRAEQAATHHWALITVSMLSAIRSRDCKLKLMPSVPMEMPSDTPMVLKR